MSLLQTNATRSIYEFRGCVIQVLRGRPHSDAHLQRLLREGYSALTCCTMGHWGAGTSLSYRVTSCSNDKLCLRRSGRKVRGPAGALGPSSAVNCTVRQVAVCRRTKIRQNSILCTTFDAAKACRRSRLCEEVACIGSRSVKHRSVLEDVIGQVRDIAASGRLHHWGKNTLTVPHQLQCNAMLSI